MMEGFARKRKPTAKNNTKIAHGALFASKMSLKGNTEVSLMRMEPVYSSLSLFALE